MDKDLEVERKLRVLVITGAALTALSAICVAARAYVRFWVLRKPGWDDYTVIAALVLACAMLGEFKPLIANGLGHSRDTLTDEMKSNFMKTAFAGQLTYYLATGLVKISILNMYTRFATTPWFSKACRYTTWFEAIKTGICFVVVLTQCIPLAKMWTFPSIEGTCIQSDQFFYATAANNVVIDIWILALPVKTLYSIQRPLRDKIILLGLFGAGSISTVVSGLRMGSIVDLQRSGDQFLDSVPVTLMSIIELNTAILCASVPALKPLLKPSRLQQTLEHRKYGYRVGDGFGGSHLPTYQSARNTTYTTQGGASSEGGDVDTIKLVHMPVKGQEGAGAEYSATNLPTPKHEV